MMHNEKKDALSIVGTYILFVGLSIGIAQFILSMIVK